MYICMTYKCERVCVRARRDDIGRLLIFVIKIDKLEQNGRRPRTMSSANAKARAFEDFSRGNPMTRETYYYYGRSLS